MASDHMKANKGWEEGCKGIIKKAFLRSGTEKKDLGRNLREKSICVKDHKINRVNCSH
jgi:hypothetical protein